ncbi:MAG: IPT/TIG domain-containing protein [Archangium sp.]|nr:IPT/TIG domain-containing protein [Archangium sp.]MDP3151487.1 IPT/TIG domain-containing protein [Archangium sp.]MDP3575379.1 IPT/TIG domain-containing protein [Archangium sp.]
MRTQFPLLFVAAFVFAACNCDPKARPDAGEPDASVEEDAGIDAGFEEVDAGEEDAGLPPELKVTRVLPPRGASAGGTSVLIEGSGFLRDFAGTGSQAKGVTTLRIGGNQVQDFQIIDDQTIELRTPPGVSGPASVSMRNPNGNFVCNNCFTYFDELVVTSFTPRTGPLAGGTEVTIAGQGFTADTQVLFGTLSSPLITFVSATQLKAVAPRGLLADVVDLVVYNKNGVSTQRRGYTYQPEVRITGISPVTGAIAGGTVVTLTGTGFAGATAVRFGATDGTSVTVVSPTQVTAVTPAAAVGAVDVTITAPAGTWTSRKAFTYFDPAGPFAVLGLSPRLIRAGDTVQLTGQALDQGALTVTIGGVTAIVGARTFSTAELTVPVRGAAPRISDVVATGGSTLTLANAATWRIALTSATPNSGPAAGGTVVALAGSAIPAGVDLNVGTFAATAVTVTNENTLQLTTPTGSGGAPSDVWIRETADVENETVLAGGFTFFEPLSIGRVQPERGAIAGNTLVTVLGSGFGDSTIVKFGPNNAKDLKFVDSHTITCRTPKGSVGVVDVRIERLTENDTLPGGFSYFDPRSISGGLSGGPLVGTLNITVLDSTRGAYGTPVPGATVLLGLDPTTPFQGTTDQRGQITFSDPSLVKAETITVVKDFYESSTVTGVNAENLTVFIARTGGGEPSSGMPPPGVPPSTIAGRVTGFKSPRPLVSGETLEARVFVAQTSLYSGPPFINQLPDKSREKWRIITDGADYLVYTGAGLRAVYAVLGIAKASNQSFTPIAMGIKRGVTTSPDNPATGKDIIIDIQLDVAVPVTIDSPLTFQGPLGPEPGFNSLYSWLELGAEGFVPNPNNWNTGTSLRTTVSSASANLTFPSFPRLDGTNFIFLNESAGSGQYPVSYYFRRQPGDLTQGVTIGPMLPAPNIVQPSLTFTGTISWTTAPGAVPNVHNIQILRPTPFANVVVWSMVLPGTETQVVVPQIAVDKLNREEAGNPLFVVIFSSRAPKFAYNQWTYDTLSGVSWSSYTIALSDSFIP